MNNSSFVKLKKHVKILIFFCFFVLINPALKANAATSTIDIKLDSESLAIGETYDVNIIARNLDNLYGLQLSVNPNPYYQVVDIEKSDFVKSLQQTYQKDIAQWNITPTAMFTNLGSSAVSSIANEKIATIKIRVTNPGNIKISDYINLKFANSESNSIPYQFNDISRSLVSYNLKPSKTYEDNNLLLKGNWGTWVDSAHSSNSVIHTNEANASAEISFTGTGFSLKSYTDNFKGQAKIYLDGSYIGLADFYSPYPIYKNTVFQKYDLTYGSHTIKIVNNSSKNKYALDNFITIDSVETYNNYKEAEGVYNSSALNRSGSWNVWSNSNHLSGSASYSNRIGDSIGLTFKGSKIKIYGYKNNDKGSADLYINGKFVQTISFYSPQEQFRQVVYENNYLPNDVNTVSLVVKENKHIMVDAFQVNYAPPIPTSGYVDAKSDLVQVSSGWKEWSDGRHYNNAVYYSNNIQDYMNFKFKGTGFRIIGYGDTDKGYFKVTIDNSIVHYVDNYRSGARFKEVLYENSSLSSGEHQVKIEVLSNKSDYAIGNFATIDGFEIINSTITNKNAIVPITSPAIVRGGIWGLWNSTNHLSGSNLYSNTKNNTLTYTFYGTGIDVIGYKNRDKGKVNIKIDNKDYGSVDTYSNSETYKSSLFSVNNLSFGNHTIVLTVTDTKNPSSLNNYINIDSFKVTQDMLPTLEKGTYFSNNSSISLVGTWDKWADQRHISKSASYSKDSNASINLNFKGNGFKLYGYKNIDKGVIKVYVNNNLVSTIDTYSTAEAFGSLLLDYKATSSTTVNSVKIEVTGTKNSKSLDSYFMFDSIDVY